MKAAIYTVLFIILLIFFFYAPKAYATEPKAISFFWAFLYWDASGEIKAVKQDQHEIELDYSDKIKFFFKPIENAYIYFFLHDSDNDLYVLFPHRFSLFDKIYYTGENYYLPDTEEWFYLDEEEGIEEFHLIVSEKRLNSLEQTIKTCTELEKNKSIQADKYLEAKHAVLDELKNLKMENLLTTSHTEKPIPIAGNIRGIKERIEFEAIEVKAEGFYVKTIKVIHH